MDRGREQRQSPWPHKLAVALALITFPLIWVGGLVTTYDAGMAVPDWPGTYGYNPLLYPWQSWLAGPWDLFIEHGHRLLGLLAGMVAIGLVAAVLIADRRRWLTIAACGALGLVIFQGLLGGARVLLDARLVALLHGCVGPLFFAYLAGLIVATSRQAPTATSLGASDKAVLSSVWTLVGLAYVQLVLGAIVRHVPLAASPQVFRAALLMHLLVASVLVIQIGLTAWRVLFMDAKKASWLRFPAKLLPLLAAAQLLLGISTYVAKYSWPDWLGNWNFAAGHVVQERSLGQSIVTTAHVAGGSLILFFATTLAMRASLLFRPAALSAGIQLTLSLAARSLTAAA